MDLIICGLVKAVSLFPRSHCKACDKFSVCCISFLKISLTVISSMELVVAKTIVVVGYRRRVKKGSDYVVNSFS